MHSKCYERLANMIRHRAVVLFIALSIFAAGVARGAEPFDFEGVTVTDAAGKQITQCQPGQALRYKAVYSLARPGLVLLYGYVTGAGWSQKLDTRIRLRLSGQYSVIWTGSVPLIASGDTRVDVVEYNPLFNERIVRTAFFTVMPFEAAYVGSDVCNGCHSTEYAAWQQTLHNPYVGCESCHGPGGDHIKAPSPATIVIDYYASGCKPCHSRNDGTVIEAENGLIKSQQQYNEWVSTKHGIFLQCGNCHNPHYSVETARAKAIKTPCQLCHPLKRIYLGMQLVKCESCHMPPAVKTSQSTGLGPYLKGDTPSHIWRIKSEASSGDMFVGSAAVKDGNGPFLTLNFACLSCHNGADSRLYDYTSVQHTATLVH